MAAKVPLVPPNAVAMSGETTTVEIFGSGIPVRLLTDGDNRLHREIEAISRKVLAKTLRRLEWGGLIGRMVYPVVPPRVEYSLTPL